MSLQHGQRVKKEEDCMNLITLPVFGFCQDHLFCFACEMKEHITKLHISLLDWSLHWYRVHYPTLAPPCILLCTLHHVSGRVRCVNTYLPSGQQSLQMTWRLRFLTGCNILAWETGVHKYVTKYAANSEFYTLCLPSPSSSCLPFLRTTYE